MSERTWTKAQQAAIEDEGGSLLIDAAAGSGKTAVLVERAVRLMSRENQAVPADKILVLTFTNAAAEELRTRLAKRLEEVLEQGGDTLFLRRQLSLLQRAFIGTIDAFCLQLVREEFAQLGTSPDLAVGQAAVLSELSEQALQTCLEEAYENEDFIRFSALYGRSRSDKEAAEAILKLYRYVDTLPWPLQQLEAFSKMYENCSELCETAWGESLFDFAKKSVNSAKSLAAIALMKAQEDGGLDAWLPMLREDSEFLERLAGLICEKNWDGCERVLRGTLLSRLATVRGYEGTGKEQVQYLRGQIKSILEDLKKHCFVCTKAEYEEDISKLAPMVRALCEVTAQYAQHYHALKLDSKAMDFSDFEHLALSLLMSPKGERLPMADEISARYAFVMVDEYQDTNELQSALYHCLGNAQEDNLFYVGDVKQSIYRFRRANPGLFLDKKQRWASYESAEKPAVLRLGHNFRSGPGVVSSVNYLFERLMSEELGEVCYDEAERLIQGRNGGTQEGFSMIVLEETSEEAEAVYVANQIMQMVQEGVLLNENGIDRACQFGDFCILLRTRSAMQTFLATLQKAKIPVSSDLEQELLKTPEIVPLQAVLAAIDNPGDDVQLAAAMLGPLFRFTLDELAVLRTQQNQGSLYGALLASQTQKCVDFLESLAHFRALSTEMDLGRLCEEIVLRTGYLSAVAAMEGGLVRRENLRRFLSWAGDMGRTLSGGLSSFVRLLQQGRGPSGAGFQHREGQVSLLTAHKSKGLEFPFVFFADTARGFNLRERSERLLIHTGLGLGLWLRTGQTLYPTLPLLAIRRRILQESLSEEMRVLYVTLTRARERLFITYAQKEPAKKIAALAPLSELRENRAGLLSRQACFGDWILSALLQHPNSTALWEYADLVFSPAHEKSKEACAMHMEVVSAVPAEDMPQNEVLMPKAEPQQVAALQKRFATRLPRRALEEIPRKLSVSALSKTKSPSLYKRPALVYAFGLTAAERGTAMHNFLQRVNLVNPNLEDEIARLVQEGLLSEEQAACLNRKALAAFFASSLFVRIQNAERILREYDFITALPASCLSPSLPKELSQEPVYLQGIADLVLLQETGLEIVDYKTDRNKTASELRAAYTEQLHLYSEAIEKRLRLPVRRLTVWSFALSEEIDLPLPHTRK